LREQGGLEGRWERRTECFNGFWDGVEGGLGGAVWLLVGGRHCGCLVVTFFLAVSLLTLQCFSSTYVSTGQWCGMVWYPRAVSLSRKVPNADDVAECPMRSESFFLLE
jgi:hypothetical protein